MLASVITTLKGLPSPETSRAFFLAVMPQRLFSSTVGNSDADSLILPQYYQFASGECGSLTINGSVGTTTIPPINLWGTLKSLISVISGVRAVSTAAPMRFNFGPSRGRGEYRFSDSCRRQRQRNLGNRGDSVQLGICSTLNRPTTLNTL